METGKMADYSGTGWDDSHWGGPGAERIEGHGGDDYLLGNGGDDEIFGGEGDDNLHGGEGKDLLEGGVGDDLLQGNEGADIVRGQAGNDRILLLSYENGGIAGDSVDGGEGVDSLQFDGLAVEAQIIFSIADPAIAQNLAGATVVNVEHLSFRSGRGNDDIIGGVLGDYIDGHDGNDRIDGGLGNDTLDGGQGTDTVYGGGGNDSIFGGQDTLYGGEGDDTFRWSADTLVDGGAGHDLLIVEYQSPAGLTVDLSNPNVETLMLGTRVTGIERLQFYAGSGDDRLTGGIGDDNLTGNGGNDIIVGGTGNDTLAGNDGYDQLSGGPGDDFLHNHTSDSNPADLIDGGEGFDRLEYRAYGATGSITIDLLAGAGMVTNVEQISFSAWNGSGANNVSGGALKDVIWGGAGGDLINGRGGDDDLRGGGGDDVIYGGGGNDYIEGELGADWLEGGDGDDVVRAGGSEASLVDGGAGDDQLSGGAGADTLIGGDGADFVYGNGGGDDLDGGSGADRFIYYSLSDSTSGAMDRVRNFQSGQDKIDLTALGEVRLSWSEATDPGTGATYSLVTVRAGTGTAILRVDSTLTRADFLADTSIDGTFRNDMLEGTDEADEISGHGGDDTIQGRSGNDIIEGGAGNDRLNGGEGDDSLNGGGGDDILVGGPGKDSYAGGDGSDTIDFSGDPGPYGVVVNLSFGVLITPHDRPDLTRPVNSQESFDGSGTYESLTAIENAVGTGYRDILYGNSFDNAFEGGGGGDVLYGDWGEDRLLGGDGDDDLNAGFGDDLLDGGAGIDTMAGGAGDDVYTVGEAGDVVTENSGEGTDEVRTALGTYVLAPNVEKLTATSDAAHDFRGNSGDNFVTGGGAADLLRLYDGGDDTVLAGAGADLIFFIGSLTGADVINGGADRDTLIIQGHYAGGLALTPNITEIEEIAILGGGNTTFGAPGTERYDYILTPHDSNFAAGVEARINAGNLLAGEDFTFDGSAETDARFVVYGGRGKDTITGSLNNDTFYFADDNRFATGDTVNGGAGYDGMFLRGNYTIDFNAPGYTGLFTSIENLTFTSASDERYARGGGTEFDYNITLSDALVGAGVTLTINGGLLMASETMILDGSLESDSFLRLFGGKSNDTLKGGGRNDLIHGFHGADMLTGNGGADTFRFDSIADSDSANMDHVLDFTPGTDKIDVSRIDANILAAGNEAFTWIGSSAFSGAAGQLRAFEQNGAWFVEGDVDGDGAADLVIQLTLQGQTPLGAGDFFL
jgi:Ca2+-binding RTX toxin-like protein